MGHEMYKNVNPETPNRYRKVEQSAVLNEVHIYTMELTKKDAVNVSIPVKAITKIDIYDKASGATAASWVFSGIGIAAGAAGVVIGITSSYQENPVLLFIYLMERNSFSPERYSAGPYSPGLERDAPFPVAGVLLLTMTPIRSG